MSEKKIDTTNPFNEGVSYKDFLSNVKGKVTVDSMLKDHKISESGIAFIKKELKTLKTK